MNQRSKAAVRILGILAILLFLMGMPSPVWAQQEAMIPEENDSETSLAQAQATMASLFGKQATLPDIPGIKGTIALPSFDSSNILMDEDVADPKTER